MNIFLNLEGRRSQVCVSRLTAPLLSPITKAKNAFRFWYSLQLPGGNQKFSGLNRAVKTELDLLSGQFNEFAQKLDAFAERVGQTNLRNDPELDLIEAAQEEVQVALGPPELLRAHHVIDQLVLKEENE